MTCPTETHSGLVETVHIERTFRRDDSVQENKAYLAGSKGREGEGTTRHINHREDRLHAHRSRLPVTTVAMPLTPWNYTAISSYDRDWLSLSRRNEGVN